MRRNKTRKNDQTVHIRIAQVLLAGGIGYLIGGWQPVAMRNTAPSAGEMVAMRFPENWERAQAVPRASLVARTTGNTMAKMMATTMAKPVATTMTAATTGTIGASQFALLNPEPMLPPPTLSQTAVPATAQADPPAPLQTASLETVDTTASSDPSATAPVLPAAASAAPDVRAATMHEAKIAAPAVKRRVANRPGYLLDDAQIASIKQRLHLTPDQEYMWPAVEAALRNMTYTREQQARGRATSASGTQNAAVDPEAVEGLKSAAVPLIMSFDAEQKEEVRNIVHVMGLDQLASQF
jgi:zinc resistance-associated protein